MAELDYAFLADYAQISSGKLTAVGASFTMMHLPYLPIQGSISVAGRVRSHIDAEPVAISFDVRGPDETLRLGFSGSVLPGPGLLPYGDGNVGLLFAFNFDVALAAEGLYELNISIDGVHARRLAFEVDVVG